MSRLSTTRLTAAALLTLAACGDKKAPPASEGPAPSANPPSPAPTPTPAPTQTPTPTPSVEPVAVEPSAVAAAPVDAPSAGTITLSVAEPASGDGPATRCVLGGDPLVVPCVGGSSMAVTPKGAVYLTDGAGAVRRYRVADGDGCALEADAGYGDGGVVAAPTKPPKPQVLGKGPTYMRSGGPDWKLTTDGETVYAFDFLLGVYRVDRGAATPVCPELQGVRGLVAGGGTALAAKDKGVRVALRGACKEQPLNLDPPPRSGVYSVGGEGWGAIASGKLARYGRSGKAAATIGGDDAFKPGGLCSTSAVAACGDDVCVLDGNCQKVSRFGADGTHRLERKLDQLLGERPYAVSAAAPAPDGGLWILTRHKDGDTCEAALYRVPGAALRP